MDFLGEVRYALSRAFEIRRLHGAFLLSSLRRRDVFQARSEDTVLSCFPHISFGV